MIGLRGKLKKMEKIGHILIIISIISIIKNKKNYILVLISLELFLLGISLLFISSAINQDDMKGLMTGLYLLTIGAAESAIGLSILTKKF